MYQKPFLNCINIMRKFSTTKCAFINSKFIISRLIYYTDHSIFIMPRYTCTDCASNKVNREYDRKYDEKLKILLQNPEQLAKFQRIKMEIEVLKHTIYTIPEVLRPYDWVVLMEANSKAQKREYLTYLWRIEMKVKKEKLEKERLQEKRKQEEQKFEGKRRTNFQNYGLYDNTLFLRIYDSKMNLHYNSVLMNAMLYGLKLVFDLSYDDEMTKYEANNCAKQLVLSYGTNRINDDPFDFYFCNVKHSNYVMERIHRIIPTLYEQDFPLNITEKSYLDLFDRKQLIYLTPHTNQIMTKFDPDSIYIIGAMVDKINRKPLSLAKAKRDGIRALSLPISEYLDWGAGSSKNLPINQVLNILLDLKYSNNWMKALENVPIRKLKKAREADMIKSIKRRDEIIQLLNNVE